MTLIVLSYMLLSSCSSRNCSSIGCGYASIENGSAQLLKTERSSELSYTKLKNNSIINCSS